VVDKNFLDYYNENTIELKVKKKTSSAQTAI